MSDRLATFLRRGATRHVPEDCGLAAEPALPAGPTARPRGRGFHQTVCSPISFIPLPSIYNCPSYSESNKHQASSVMLRTVLAVSAVPMRSSNTPSSAEFNGTVCAVSVLRSSPNCSRMLIRSTSRSTRSTRMTTAPFFVLRPRRQEKILLLR